MKRILFLAALLLCALPTFAQNMRVDDVAFKGTTPTQFAAGATITVCNSLGSGLPCTPKVLGLCSGVSDAVCSQPNPTISDAVGNFGFWIQPGTYVVTVTGSGLSGYSKTLVLSCPLSGNCAFTGTNTSGNFNAQFFVDGTQYSGCPAAVTAAGTTNGATVTIPGTGPIVSCPLTIPENIVLRNLDRTRDQCNGIAGSATPPCNAENYNYDDGNVMAGRRFEFTTSHQDLNGVSLGLYSITTLKNATANGSSGIDGFSAEADTAGTLTGSFGLQAHEANISVQSAGGTIANAYAVIGAVGTFNSSGNCVGSANCTALTNAIGIKGYGCRVPAGAVPVNCYGGYFLDQQSRASARSYSLGIEGKGLLVCTSSGCGLDAEDQSHVTHSFLFVDGTSTTSLQALSASQGINFLNSAGQLALNLGVAGLAKFSSVLVPNTAGNQDLGTTALPFGNLFIGPTANSYKFQPAAAAAARTINLWDFGANGPSTQNYPGITILTSQYTNSTTGMTTVTGGNTLQFPVLANTTYTAECHLYYQAAATGGLNIQFTGPAAATAIVYGLNLPVSATTQAGNSVATAFSTSLGAVVTTAATNFDAIVSLSLINGANSGTVVLQAKSSAAVQLQIQAGSFCRVQ